MAKASTKYLDLIEAFRLRPIESDMELRQGTTVLHTLLDRDKLSTQEEEYLQVLGNLIEAYETEHVQISDVEPHVMLAGLIEEKGVSQSEVARATGIPVSTISELLSRKRDFNVAHVEKLCAYFGVGPQAFIQVKELAAK